MTVYRLDSTTGEGARTGARRHPTGVGRWALGVGSWALGVGRWALGPQARILVVSAAALAAAGAAAFGVKGYIDSPDRVAGDFLAACRDRNPARIRPLLDPTYQEVFPDARSADLLAALGRDLPRGYSSLGGAFPSTGGLVLHPDRYHVRVELRDPPELAASHAWFVVTLRRPASRKPSGWRVDFLPTYASLLTACKGPEGGEDLRRVVWQSAGQQALRLSGWDRTGRLAMR